MSGKALLNEARIVEAIFSNCRILCDPQQMQKQVTDVDTVMRRLDHMPISLEQGYRYSRALHSYWLQNYRLLLFACKLEICPELGNADEISPIECSSILGKLEKDGLDTIELADKLALDQKHEQLGCLDPNKADQTKELLDMIAHKKRPEVKRLLRLGVDVETVEYTARFHAVRGLMFLQEFGVEVENLVSKLNLTETFKTLREIQSFTCRAATQDMKDYIDISVVSTLRLGEELEWDEVKELRTKMDDVVRTFDKSTLAEKLGLEQSKIPKELHLEILQDIRGQKA